MSKFVLLTTPRLDGQNKSEIRQAVASSNEGYRVASVKDAGEVWEIRLEQLATDKVSNRTRQAAPPPDFLKEKGDDAPEDEEEAEETPDEEAKEDSGEVPDDDAEAKDDSEKGDKPKGKDKGGDDPVKAIENIMGELNKLLTDLGGHAQKLKEKADKVDEVHELTKGPDLVDDMGEVPPVPAVDGPEGVGPTPGGGPVPAVPHKPPVPTGHAPVRPVGVPTFTKKKTKIVEHPIKDADGEYTLADFLAAIATDPQLDGYELAEVKTLKEANVYAGKLELAE